MTENTYPLPVILVTNIIASLLLDYYWWGFLSKIQSVKCLRDIIFNLWDCRLLFLPLKVLPQMKSQ